MRLNPVSTTERKAWILLVQAVSNRIFAYYSTTLDSSPPFNALDESSGEKSATLLLLASCTRRKYQRGFYAEQDELYGWRIPS